MVTFTLPVRAENKREFERYVTACASYFNFYVTTAGKPPVLASYPFATIPSQSGYMFRQVGDFWQIAYEGKELPAMKDTKAFHYIAYLLRQPGQSFFSTELVAMFNGVNSQGFFMSKKDMDQSAIHVSDSQLQLGLRRRAGLVH